MAIESDRDPRPDEKPGERDEGRLGSWKEIAAYLNCGVRTVQRWERLEGLPVHRHVHSKMGTVYAYRHELDAWRRGRTLSLDDDALAEVPEAAGDAAPVGESPGLPAPLPEVTRPSPSPRPARPAWLGKAVVGGILVLALVLVALQTDRVARPRPQAQTGRVMLAVLPFQNLSGDPGQDYFSDGLTEEMTTQLGRVDPARLGVIARTSAMQYKNTTESVAEIGHELGVNYILEGSVRRQAPGKKGGSEEVRVSAQLIQVSDQTHLWAKSYDFRTRDVLAVQREAARAINTRITAELAPSRPTPATERPVNLEAYENYLKGRYFWNLRSDQGLLTAVDYFKRSTTGDPNYAPAYAGLADCYTLLALYGAPPREVLPLAKLAALKSVALDDSLAEAHTSLAGVAAVYDWNWPEAEREFKRALVLDPNYAPAHHWYAQLYLIPQGRYDEAIAEMQLALTLDPVSLIINTDLGWTYFVARRDDLALAQYQKALQLSPQFVPVHFRLSQYYAEKQQYDKAAAEAEAARRLDGNQAGAAALASAFAAGGFRAVIGQELKEAAAGAPFGQSASTAADYAKLGENDLALEALSRAFTDHAVDLIYLHADPEYDPLRSDPRFQEFERRVGLLH